MGTTLKKRPSNKPLRHNQANTGANTTILSYKASAKKITTQLFFKMFLWPMPLFLHPTQKQCMLSHFIHNSTAVFPYKTLYPGGIRTRVITTQLIA
jgi:hypothetical protein